MPIWFRRSCVSWRSEPPALVRTCTVTEVIFVSTASTLTQTFRPLTLASMAFSWAGPGLMMLSRETAPLRLITSSAAA